MGTITGKFHQNPLKTVGGVAETRLCLRTDGWTDGRTHYYSPLRLTSGDKNTHKHTNKHTHGHGKLYNMCPFAILMISHNQIIWNYLRNWNPVCTNGIATKFSQGQKIKCFACMSLFNYSCVFLCPRRNFGWHIKIAPSVRLSVRPLQIVFQRYLINY